MMHPGRDGRGAWPSDRVHFEILETHYKKYDDYY